ncbi:DMT family transporter [Bradyrhizobium genosp. P]|uniref:DMT family transporter n=1 Tax=Bradyrhizobium genosp. P TaxID=83641 RepID=UPI003CF009CA
MQDFRNVTLTALALFCFAANSILCRLALAPRLIDPASFTTVRILSAATILTGLIAIGRRKLPSLTKANWRSTASLFTYLIFFSFAYARLSAGTGALILFGSVQMTMFGVVLRRGQRLRKLSWAGLGLAAAGLVYLVMPGITAPDPVGLIFMIISGIAWGAFSLFAKGVDDPIKANACSFIGCVPLTAICSVWFLEDFHMSGTGFFLAIASGAVASGIGYGMWYFALRYLPTTHASALQLLVPAIAAIGGDVLLSEPFTFRLVAASCALLGGVAVVVTQRPLAQSSGRLSA